ncbi:MAG: dockerin type I repeat-containing protein [candidate division Zixibacteria bacterium]
MRKIWIAVVPAMTILCFALIAIWPVTGSDAETVKRNFGPQKVGDISGAGEMSQLKSLQAGCELLEYTCNITYFWPLPSEYGDDFYNMRFTPPEPTGCTLTQIQMAFHEDGSINVSWQGIDVYVWEDDGSGFPGTVLDIIRIPAEAIAWYPSTVIAVPNYPIVLGNDFHIGYTTVEQEVDVFALLSDDGSCGNLRSSYYIAGGWHELFIDYDIDVNFLIAAEICCPASTNEVPHVTNHPEILNQSYCSNLYYDYFGEDPEEDEIWFEFLSGPGTMDSATGEWSYQPSESDIGDHQLAYQVCDASGCSDIMYTTLIIENYEPQIVSPCGTIIEGTAGDRIQYIVEAIGPERCDDLTYYMMAGPGTIDASTGVYSWETGPSSAGVDIVTIGVSDGFTDVACDFIVDVAEEGVCGDANGDGSINVGDAVFLISHVFKGGPPPDPFSSGDANGDGGVNVGDAVYIISHVFKDGPEPCAIVEPCCDAPPCMPNPVIPVTYDKIASPTANCGGNFGLWEGWTMTAQYAACCLDGVTWQMRVEKVRRPYSISVCARGRTDINSADDVDNVADCQSVVADLEFTGAPAPGRPAKVTYTSTDCTEDHEQKHQDESQTAIDAAWVAGEAAIEALTVACVVPECDTPAEAVAAMIAAANASLAATQATAWANTPNHGPPDTSGAYAAQKACHDALIAALKAAHPGC